MPYASLAFPPGVNTQLSRTMLADGFSSSELIRFQFGQVQKYGGWQRLTSTPLIGVCRGMHAWSDLTGNPFLALGTNERLEIYKAGVIIDITPIRATTNNAPNFSTTINTTTVTIHDVGHAAAAGDWINIIVPVSVGGIVLLGFYQVTVVVGANDYEIEAADTATATVASGGAVPQFTTTAASSTVKVTLNDHGYTASDLFEVQVSTTVSTVVIFGAYSVDSVINGNNFNITGTVAGGNASGFENAGNARIEYLLSSGLVQNTATSGYGVGIYGAGIYGAGIVGSLISPLRQWFLDNWGEFLIGNPTNGAIYVWFPATPDLPAVVVATAPSKNTASFVLSQAQILVCLGAEDSGTQYPNLVKWSNVADYTDFIPTPSNQAGSFNIPSGSRIVAGMAVGLGALIWTDVDLWSMTYQGLPFVFGFNKLSSNCEAISARAPATIGQIVMWPSDRGFFRYENGSVVPVPCPVWDFFFNNVDFEQTGMIFGATNTLFNELAWFFPFNEASGLQGQFGMVKYNILENSWDISSTLYRTAWIDHSPVGNPMGTDANNLIQQHEEGHDADGVPMLPSITSGLASLGDGENFWFVDLILPDVVPQGAPVLQLTLYASDYPFSNEIRTYGPYTVTYGSTPYISTRIRGRQVGYSVSSSDLGTAWRLGQMRARYRPDGRV